MVLVLPLTEQPGKGNAFVEFLTDSPEQIAESTDRAGLRDEEYTRLFENGFSLLHRGNVRIYEERFNNPHQHYWLFQR